MLKFKLLMLGFLFSIATAYSSPVGISPIIHITNVSSSGFVVNWSPASITDLNEGASYLISYTVTVTGPGGLIKSTNSTSITFSGLQSSTNYSVKLQTYAQIIGQTATVSFSPVTTSVSTAIANINTVSTDFTQQTAQNVVLKAKTSIVLANGFHYRATNGYSLITQLLPNTKSDNVTDEYTICPERIVDYDAENVSFNKASHKSYEVIQSQQGSLLIRNKNFDYSDNKKSEYYEIIEMKSGKINKKGRLTEYETQIDISNLMSGYYVIKVSNGLEVYTQKMMIRN